MPGSLNLQGYITQVRRLLKDPNAAYWTDADLTAYINEAIGQVVPDTGCLRAYQTITLVPGQDLYNFNVFTDQPVINIVGAFLVYGQERIPLNYKCFTEINAYERSITNYKQWPSAINVYQPAGTFYLAPIPDQDYPLECDTVYLPANLVNYTDVCPILDPFVACVKYFAAFLAQMQYQSMEKSDFFLKHYYRQCLAAVGQSFTARIPYVYQNS